VPPFYDNVFREEDYRSEKFILHDPLTVMRARPLWPDQIGMGPNDILGFRNRAVPNVADIVTMGDSQTYGNNAPLEYNWPSRLKAHITQTDPIVYNMSVGAWSGPQYLEMFPKAVLFQPRVIVVAFYTGNDPAGAFVSAYGSEHWDYLRLDPSLKKADAPSREGTQSDTWPVRFRDGSSTVFTPSYRLVSNIRKNPAIETGYKILAEAARRITILSKETSTPVVFCIIPTKELVYEKKVRAEGIPFSPSYKTLVESERAYIEEFTSSLKAIDDLIYVDLITPLEQTAMDRMLYPSNEDGHPLSYGYDVIARAIAPAISPYLKRTPPGFAAVSQGEGQFMAILVKEDGFFLFASKDLIVKNGWKSLAEANRLTHRDIATLPFKGIITSVDPERYGPSAF
jgi:lysophospholipase L1-like esterase